MFNKSLVILAAFATLGLGCDDGGAEGSVDAASMAADMGAEDDGGAGGEAGGDGEGGSGEGGAGGDAGAGGDGMGGEGGAMGDPCETACGTLADCAAGDDLCPGVDAAGRDALYDGCLVQCAGLPALAAAVNNMDSCDAVVEFIGGANPGFADLCEGPPSDEECGEAMEAVLDCYVSDAPDHCANVSAEDREAVRGSLRALGATCPEDGAFLRSVVRDLECPEIIEAVSQSLTGGRLNRICDGIGASEACAVVGDRVSECAIERCPALEDHAAGVAAESRWICQGILAGDGQRYLDAPADEATIMGRIGPETPCDDPEIAAQVQTLLDDTPLVRDGHLARACAGEPAVEAGTCAAACDQLEACVVDDAILLGDRDICLARCFGDAAEAERFECAGAAGDCDAVVECLIDVPRQGEVPECDAVAPRLAACYVERCPAMAATEEDAAGWLGLVCRNAINAGTGDAGQLLAALPEDVSCDDPNMAAFVDTLAEDRMLLVDGRLTDSCEPGPLVDADTCAAACEAFVPCTAPTSGFRVEGVCPFVCQSFEQVGGVGVWACVAEAAAAGGVCPDFNRCFAR